jgi:hypothetical protein
MFHAIITGMPAEDFWHEVNMIGYDIDKQDSIPRPRLERAEQKGFDSQ